MDTLGKKLRKLREFNELTTGQVGAKVGISRSLVSLWESDKRSPRYKELNELASLFSVSVDYLIGTTTVPTGVFISNVKVMTNKIHVYGHISAGTQFDAINDLFEDMEIPNWLAEKKDLFGLKVVGDSMNKILPDGAIAVLQRTEFLNNGEIGAIMVNGFDATLKKFYKLTESIVLEPLSYNPKNKPIVVAEGSQEVRPIGKLLWYCSGGVIQNV